MKSGRIETDPVYRRTKSAKSAAFGAEQMADRRNSCLKTRTRISDRSARRFFAMR
jgi:hypothetical protein